jgi:hypothetical protein
MIIRALILIFLGSFIDLTLWGYMQGPVSSFSRAVLYTLIGSHAPLEIVIIGLVPALFPFFFLSDSVGIEVFIFVFLGSLLYYVCSVTDIPRWGLMCAIFCTVIIHSFLLERLIGKVPMSEMLLFAFLSTVSVVYFYTGSQGNRSPW